MRNRSRMYGAKMRARAAAGAALLDRITPGWWRLVRLRPLDIQDECNCVTGQLFGTYSKALDRLDLTIDEAKDYGFYVKDGDSGYGWHTLTEAWKNEVRKRRDGSPIGRAV